MTKKQRQQGPFYTARIVAGPSAGSIWYEHEPNGNLIGLLPLGTRPAEDCGTLDRKDDGDPFECARFQSESGRVFEVRRES